MTTSKNGKTRRSERLFLLRGGRVALGKEGVSLNKEWLAFEAKSFYNAYLNLEWMNQSMGGTNFFIPMAVNGSFSIELSIKAILVHFGIPYDREHNLLALFRLLPVQLQDIFWRYLAYKAPEYADEKRRHDELVMISNVFVDWRYGFEGDPAPAFETRFLAAFANTAIWVMFALGMDYEIVERSKDKMDKSDEEIIDMIDQNRAETMNKILAKVDIKRST